MSEIFLEALQQLKEEVQIKDRDWIKDKFRKAVHRYIPINSAAEIMYNDKIKRLSEDEWRRLEQHINELKFPLTIYRGLVLDDIKNVDLNDLGINWTLDTTLFTDKSSAFKDCNYILSALVNEKDVDWEDTISNYIYYTLTDKFGHYPEKEITLLKSAKPKNVELKEKSEFFKG